MFRSDEGRRKELTEVYVKTCLESVAIAGGRLVDDDTVSLTLSQRDVDGAGAPRKSAAEYRRAPDGRAFCQCAPSVPIQESLVLTSWSPSASHALRIVKVKDHFRLEFWSPTRLVGCVSTDGIHGAVLTDPTFAGVAWSKDEQRVAYVAQPLERDAKSFFHRDSKERKCPGDQATEPDKKKETDSPSLVGAEADLLETWGEQYLGVDRSRVFVVERTARPRVYPVSGIDDDLCVGQPQFVGDGLLLCGWRVPSHRFGIIYCLNHASSLFFASPALYTSGATSETPKLEQITSSDDDFAVRSPRVSPDGSFVVFLSIRETHRHNTCSLLRRLDWPSRTLSTLVDSVVAPAQPNDFPGLFLHSLPKRCFTSENQVYLTTQWGPLERVIAVDAATGTLAPHTCTDKADASASVLDVFGSLVLLLQSSHSQRPHAMVFDTASSSSTPPLSLPIPSQPLEDPTIDVCTFALPNVFCVLARPTVSHSDPPPLVVIPHGGPHGAYINTYSPTLNFLHALGYATLQVNYRGSTGRGLEFLESLSGHVGTMEVEDMVEAVDHVCAMEESRAVDPARLFLWGGSHGGWVCAHMVVQHPTRFSAAVLHNPVTNLVSDLVTSDIGDWVCSVSGIDPTCAYRGLFTEEQHSRLFRMSPVSHVGPHVRTPTLFKLGGVDLRVPPTQGLELYRAFQHFRVPTHVLWYKDEAHPISGVKAEADSWINTVLWFEHSLKAKEEQST